MPHSIRVECFDRDPSAEELAQNAKHLLSIAGLDVKRTLVYRFEGVTEAEVEKLGAPLHDPITEHVTYGARVDWDNDNKVEVAPKPGAMVPEEQDLMGVAALFDIKPSAVSVSTEYTFGPSVSAKARNKVVGRLLVNPTIEEVRTEEPATLAEKRTAKGIEQIPIRSMGTKELLELSDTRGLALDQAEMEAIKNEFVREDREPTDVEMEYMGGRWSDHCVHKTWSADIYLPDGTRKKSFMKRVKESSIPYHEKAGVRSAFGDNSGAVDSYEGRAITVKGETHISPTGKEPFAGAGTGVGGDQRDIRMTGHGPVRQIAGAHALVFASPNANLTLKPEGMLDPAWIAKRTIEGIVDYGNKTGIPEAQGTVIFMHGTTNFEYTAKPCCLVVGFGETGAEDAVKGVPEVGNRLLLVGGRTGRDGIHGANASSVTAQAVEKAAFGSFVQKGNPIEQKVMHDLVEELGRRKLYTAGNDLGASGIASGAAEMGEEIGVHIQLGDLPTKYEGLETWEKFISESQERAVIAVDPGNVDEIMELAELYGSEVTDIGFFDGTKRLTVYDGNELAVDLDYEFIINGIPKRRLVADWQPPTIEELVPSTGDLGSTLHTVMAHGAVSSKELVDRQFDQTVQGGNVLPAYGGVHDDTPNDAAVTKIYSDRPYGMVTSMGINPNLIRLDPYNGAMWACVESVSKNVAVGGDPDAMFYNENFIWASPTPQNVGSQDLAVDAVVDFQHVTQAPVVSGKDSQSGSFQDKKNDVLIENGGLVGWTTVSKIPDVAKTVSSDFKKAGSQVVLVGIQDLEAMGGSAYYDVAGGSSSKVPHVDLGQLMPTLRTVHGAIKAGNVLAAHSVSVGGIGKTLSEMCFGGDCGGTFELDGVTEYSAENQLYNETPGCFILELPASANTHDVLGDTPHRVIGTTTNSKKLELHHNNSVVLAEDISNLKKTWQGPMQEFYS